MEKKIKMSLVGISGAIAIVVAIMLVFAGPYTGLWILEDSNAECHPNGAVYKMVQQSVYDDLRPAWFCNNGQECESMNSLIETVPVLKSATYGGQDVSGYVYVKHQQDTDTQSYCYGGWKTGWLFSDLTGFNNFVASKGPSDGFAYNLEVEILFGTESCIEGETRCNPTAPDIKQVCINSVWQDDVVCTHGCIEGVCLECTDGNLRCNPEATKEVQYCQNGFWEQNQICSYDCLQGECIPEPIEPVCTEGNLRCDPSNNDNVQKCTNNEWVQFEACAETCVDGECVTSGVEPVCTDGNLRCNPTNEYRVDICSSGQWVSNKECSYGCLSGECIDAPIPDVCTDGNRRCSPLSDDVAQECVNGLWIDDSVCVYGCNDGECISSGGDDTEEDIVPFWTYLILVVIVSTMIATVSAVIYKSYKK